MSADFGKNLSEHNRSAALENLSPDHKMSCNGKKEKRFFMKSLCISCEIWSNVFSENAEQR